MLRLEKITLASEHNSSAQLLEQSISGVAESDSSDCLSVRKFQRETDSDREQLFYGEQESTKEGCS